jgi:hypothetical protein
MAPSNFNKLEIPLIGNWFTSFPYYVFVPVNWITKRIARELQEVKKKYFMQKKKEQQTK